MPLSEHEQRLLEQIEQALYAEDPKFAHSWRARDLRSVRRRRVVRAVLVVVAGLGLLVAGVVVQGGDAVLGVILGVVGLPVHARRRLARRVDPAAAGGGRARRRCVRPPQAPAARRASSPALEQRWQRRQDGR